MAMPKARDATARPPVIPGSVAAARGQPQGPAAAKRQTEKDLQVSVQESHTSAGGTCLYCCSTLQPHIDG